MFLQSFNLYWHVALVAIVVVAAVVVAAMVYYYGAFAAGCQLRVPLSESELVSFPQKV